jgi:hypothetical protein
MTPCTGRARFSAHQARGTGDRATRFLDSNQGGQPDNRERHTNHQQVYCEPLRYLLLRFLGHSGSSDNSFYAGGPEGRCDLTHMRHMAHAIAREGPPEARGFEKGATETF